MSGDLIYNLPEVAVVAVLFALLVLAGEAGFRFGGSRRERTNEAAKSQIGAIQGAMLGLLSLLLGFTFSMAGARFDARKQLVTEEANTIGTAAARGELLADPFRARVADDFRRYVDVRVQARTTDQGGSMGEALEKQAAALQDQMWRDGRDAIAADRQSLSTILFLQSLTDIGDVRAKRTASINNHVPEIILLLLFSGSILTLGIVGYVSGLGNQRLHLGQLVLSILVTLVIYVIIDLDRPLTGLIQVKQDTMLRLKDTLDANVSLPEQRSGRG